jgi:hypothetical protein
VGFWVDQVGEVVASIPAAQRADTIVLTQTYQQAAALDLLRSASRVTIPAVYSGHNGFWFWGPPPESATDAIVIRNFCPADLATGYAHCEVVATVQTPPGVDNDLTGTPIHRCTGLRQPWSVLWPQLATFASPPPFAKGERAEIGKKSASASLESMTLNLRAILLEGEI